MTEQECVCGTRWNIDIEKMYPELVEKFHTEQHAKWEQAMFERRQSLANFVFDLPENTKWVRND